MTSKKILYTDKEQENIRLDKFLAQKDPSNSRTSWQKMISSGEVLVNKKITTTKYEIKGGDEIEIIKETKNTEKAIKTIPDLEIIYEDNDVIVIDKPVGIIAHAADSSDSPTVSSFLEKHFPPIKKIGEEEQKSGIVHRLDKDTSGIMIAAKNQESFDFLKNKFKSREVVKTYTALVHGKVTPKKGKINFPIGRNPKKPYLQTIVKNTEKAKIKYREALTLYETTDSFRDFSLLSVNIKTGRMHQIRVHMKSIGNPIVGDQKYTSQKLKEKVSLKRQFLHAGKLEIILPNGKKGVFKSSLPKDLSNFLEEINNNTLD